MKNNMSSSIDENKQKHFKHSFFKLSKEKQKINLLKNRRNQSLFNKSNFTDLNSNQNTFCKKITHHFVYKNPSNSLVMQSSFKPFTKINNIKLQNYRKNSAELNRRGNNGHNNSINLIFNNFNLPTKNTDSKKNNNYDNTSNNNTTMFLMNKNINKVDEYKKKYDQINLLYKEKVKENKNINNKMVEMKKENLQLRKTIFKLEQENKEFIKIFETMQKLIKVLQNSGIDVEELIDNISSNSENTENNEITKTEYNNENDSDKNESITTENFKCHDTFKGSKLIVKENSIPKLNIKKIKKNISKNDNDNNNANQDKNEDDLEELTLNKNKKNRKKYFSHSVEK